ncbi:6136_t:CDS:2 [Acaulospora morrowiae]|uniref:6136_t:CDS:1 n=1 Tax=Acaulospora morrowiae TaxID=94023 RepID=A0A9N9FMZ9_9GLOM|nr:6136_t:CDS:2 [Acaulospora morrowiae]
MKNAKDERVEAPEQEYTDSSLPTSPENVSEIAVFVGTMLAAKNVRKTD